MATITGMTAAATTAALAAKADLVGGVVPDSQIPAIAVKKGDLVINVKDPAYGAIGNGVAYDDTALLAAIAAVPAAGGQVFLPAGSYLLNGATVLALSVSGTTIRGAGAEATKIVIGSGYTGGSVISITAANCKVMDLSIVGASSTITSNPVVMGISTTAAKRAKIVRCNFWYINAWAISIAADATSTGTPDGTLLSELFVNLCAGGIHFLGNTASSYSMACFMSNVEVTNTGVTTGSSASLDSVRFEDSWDILVNNLLSWVSLGSGHAVHLVGNCVSIFVHNLDAGGPTTSSNVLIEDGTNGASQNIQFNGGVVQGGLHGFRITGASNNIHVTTMRCLNNQKNGFSIEGTGVAIHLRDVFTVSNGASASGSNYDINWSGTSTGYVTDSRLASAITTVGTAGVQASVNASASLAGLRFINVSFSGTGASSANWFTNAQLGVLETTSGVLNFVSSVTLSAGALVKSKLSYQPSVSTNAVASSNTNGTDTFDTWILDGTGKMSIGPGGSTGTRDTFYYRSAVNTLKTDGNLVVGGALTLPGGTYRNAPSAQVVVANTVTATDLAVLIIPASEMVVGATYRIKAWGIVSTTGTPTVKFQAMINSSSMASTGTLTPVTAALSSKSWSCEVLLVVLSIGSSGTVLGHLIFPDFTQSAIAGNPSTTTRIIEDGSAASTINTTSVNQLSIRFTWGTASASNTITCYGAIIERVS
jgi:hypothetical protein